MLNREIEIKSSLINRKNIYRQLIKVIEVANNFNNGSSDIDLDLDFIHQNFRLKALFSAITLNKSPQTLGYLEKRGSPWLGFVKFCNVIRGEIEPKLGEFSFCNHLLLGKKDISEDEINQTSDNCTKNLNLNMRID